jgi:hypothetical protein
MNGPKVVRLGRTLLVCLTLAMSSVVFAPAAPAAGAVSDDMMLLPTSCGMRSGRPRSPRTRGSSPPHRTTPTTARPTARAVTSRRRVCRTTPLLRARSRGSDGTLDHVRERSCDGGSSGVAGVRQLWDAPYHRLGMMHPSASSMVWASHAQRPEHDGRRHHLQLRHPLRRLRALTRAQPDEHPHIVERERITEPAPGGATRPVGYPIMVVYSGGQNVVMRALKSSLPWRAPCRSTTRRSSSSTTTSDHSTESARCEHDIPRALSTSPSRVHG